LAALGAVFWRSASGSPIRRPQLLTNGHGAARRTWIWLAAVVRSTWRPTIISIRTTHAKSLTGLGSDAAIHLRYSSRRRRRTRTRRRVEGRCGGTRLCMRDRPRANAGLTHADRSSLVKVRDETRPMVFSIPFFAACA